MIDLTVWNITLPIQTPALTVATKAVPTLRNQYFTNTGDKIVFWVPVTGSHTGKREYPRSELRETSKDGKWRNWRYNSGVNTLDNVGDSNEGGHQAGRQPSMTDAQPLLCFRPLMAR
ncbi:MULTISPECIES: polysaccharide lyase family 7 protein [unclassified Pseudomonas]|uniref:polysaccharide lyase family 7 protein n=1 Tax=unclassified Pseudomonas TaxID=196821 RepID=UPI0030DD6F20